MQLRQGERLKLPENLRFELSVPVGPVYNENDAMKIIEKRYVISIGDETTLTLIKNNFEPMLAIFDLKTKRESIDSKILMNHFKEKIVVENPPGCITYDLWNGVKMALENKDRAILVVGEEDMASIPSIYHSRDGVIIIYGIPNKGLNIIEVGKDIREKVKNLLKMMVREYGS